MTVYGLILAGGQGSRLGYVRKGDLRIGGVRMIERVAAALSSDTDHIYVATGSDPVTPLVDATAVGDLVPNEGPMGGLRAFLHHAPPDDDTIVVTTSVDSPFLPKGYAKTMREALKNNQKAVVSIWRDQIYPTHAAWRVSDLKRVAHFKSPKRGLEALAAAKIDWSGELANPFQNINDFSEFLAAQGRIEAWGKDE